MLCQKHVTTRQLGVSGWLLIVLEHIKSTKLVNVHKHDSVIVLAKKLIIQIYVLTVA